MMHPQACPDRAELEDFILGKLSATTFTHVIDHVEQCAACTTILGSLDQAADPLLSRLSRFSPVDGSESREVLQGLIIAVSSARAGRGPSAWFSAEGDGRRLGKF